MTHTLIYPAGITDSCICAAENLRKLGFSITDHPEPEITHLLLDVPSFRPDGFLRDGKDPEKLLSMLPQGVAVAGGNLNHPTLTNQPKMDFLKDDLYLARNAAITADCALKIAAPMLKTTLPDTRTLILGWGRIGKCLAQMLKAIGTPVTVAARKETDRALLLALGFDAIAFQDIPSLQNQYGLLFNTVPAPVLSKEDIATFNHCVMIDLASSPGIAGSDVICARGLPGIYAPVSAGKLIADSFYRLWKEDHK